MWESGGLHGWSGGPVFPDTPLVAMVGLLMVTTLMLIPAELVRGAALQPRWCLHKSRDSVTWLSFPSALVLGPPHLVTPVAVHSSWAGAVGEDGQVEVAVRGGAGVRPIGGPPLSQPQGSCWAHALVSWPLSLTLCKWRGERRLHGSISLSCRSDAICSGKKLCDHLLQKAESLQSTPGAGAAGGRGRKRSLRRGDLGSS